MLVALLALQLVLHQYNLSQARADTTSTMCVLYSTLFVYSCRKWSRNIRVHQYVQCIGRALRGEAGGPSLAPLVVGRRINVSIIQTSAKMPRLTASSGATPLLRQITVAIISPPPPPHHIPLSSGFVYCTQMKCKYFIVRKEIVLVGSVCIC